MSWVTQQLVTFGTPAAKGQVKALYPALAFAEGYNDTSKRGKYAPDEVYSVIKATWRTPGFLRAHLHMLDGIPQVGHVSPFGWHPGLTNMRVTTKFRDSIIVPAGFGYDGYKGVHMAWPQDDVWNNGEADALEYDYNPSGSYYFNMHATDGDPRRNVVSAFWQAPLVGDRKWHTHVYQYLNGVHTAWLDGVQQTCTDQSAAFRGLHRWDDQQETWTPARNANIDPKARTYHDVQSYRLETWA